MKDTDYMNNAIAEVCDEIKEMLQEKNASYGNASAQPVSIFSRASAIDRINVRIDDKLQRMANGFEFGQDDTELDLIGYLILKRCIQA
jgi:hypothetical protein